MKKNIVMLVAFVFAGLFFSHIVDAAEAQRYSVAIPGEKIDINTDHYTVSLIKGWISSNDSFFKKVFSKRAKLIVSIDRNITFFDAKVDAIVGSTVHENTDIGSNVYRPWGININVLDNIPADAKAEMLFRIVTSRDDRINAMLNGLSQATAGATDILSQPAMSYGKVVSSLITSLFGTNKDEYLFYWTGEVKLTDVVPAGGKEMAAHYIVLIANTAKNKLSITDSNKLVVDEKNNRLLYDTKDLDALSVSYAILKVSKSAGYNIAQLLFDSNASWAILGRDQFLVLPFADLKDAAQVRDATKNVVKLLQNESALLLSEQRFTKFDRAVSLMFLAARAKEQIVELCNNISLNDAACPTANIDSFTKTISVVFNLDKSAEQKVKDAAGNVRKDPHLQQKIQELKIAKTSL